jgi:O-antigen ligase
MTWALLALIWACIAAIAGYLAPRHIVGVILGSPLALLIFLGLLRFFEYLSDRHGLDSLLWAACLVVLSLSPHLSGHARYILRIRQDLLGLLEPVVTIVAFLYLVLQVVRQRMALLTWFSLPLVLPMVGYAVLGQVLFLHAIHRSSSLLYASQLLTVIGLTIVVSRRRAGQPSIVLGLVVTGFGLVLALACALLIIDPGLVWPSAGTTAERLGGALLHPNQLGYAAAIPALACLGTLLAASTWKRRLLSGGGLVLAGGVVLASRGRADLVGMGLGAVLLIYGLSRGRLLAAAGAIFAVGAAIKPDWLSRLVLAFNRGGVAELGGRVELWQAIWAAATLSPLRLVLGAGYGVSDATLKNLVADWPNVPHAHNLVIEGFLALGFPGAALILASVLVTGLAAWQLLRSHWSGERLVPVVTSAMLTCLMVISLVEASYAGKVTIYTFGYLGVLAILLSSGQAGWVFRPQLGATSPVSPDD